MLFFLCRVHPWVQVHRPVDVKMAKARRAKEEKAKKAKAKKARRAAGGKKGGRWRPGKEYRYVFVLVCGVLTFLLLLRYHGKLFRRTSDGRSVEVIELK